MVNDQPEAPIRFAPTGSVALATEFKAPFTVLRTTVNVLRVPAALTPEVPVRPEEPDVPEEPKALVPEEPAVPAVPLAPELPYEPQVPEEPELPE